MRGQTTYSTTIVSFATQSSAVDLGQNWDSAYLVVQSMTSNSQIHLRASDSLSGTYRRVQYASIATSSVQANDWALSSASTSAIVPIPQGLRYIKVETTAVLSASQAFTILVSGA
jgi:hypothetical protein